MKQSLSYLEKGQSTILKLGYGFIEFKSKLKKAFKMRYNISFQKEPIGQRVLD